MIEKHGSEQAVRDFLSEKSREGGGNPNFKEGKGYFKQLKETDPNKLREISARGGRRGHNTTEQKTKGQ